MVLQSYFTEEEISMIVDALNAQETKWNAVAKRPVQGWGKATELVKKDIAATKARSFNELLNKIVEYTV